ncbi:uncharacterized protein LOC132268537 [Cornus florida]|uniref:uncharacterized protein LOC132268537 n=1 Tax=Cornus florida TaxID=4283 RepID=UPI002898B7BD|nr:uncharacterized protein LOC132268537 [Cornus florida]
MSWTMTVERGMPMDAFYLNKQWKYRLYSSVMGKTAISASEKIHFETPEKPDSVIRLLRNHGFSNTQIALLVRKRPLLLLTNPVKTLLPKLEFFQSIGVLRSDLAKLICATPNLLAISLENQIVPKYNFLNSVLQSNQKVFAAIKHTDSIFLADHAKNLLPNIALLRELGVPVSCIVLLLSNFTVSIMQRHGQFSEIVTEVKEMGFDPLKSTFVLALHAISGTSTKLRWNRCYEAYKKWGSSKDDFLLAFRNRPLCMCLSEKKITKTMDFFVKQMGWQSTAIERYPSVLFFSLEKRIIPRCLVIRVLTSKGLIKKDLSASTFLMPGEKCFLERFVTKNEEELPELLSVYQGKVDALEL